MQNTGRKKSYQIGFNGLHFAYSFLFSLHCGLLSSVSVMKYIVVTGGVVSGLGKGITIRFINDSFHHANIFIALDLQCC